MTHKYLDILLTFLFTLFLNITPASFFSILASFVVIVRGVYLIIKDVTNDFDGNYKAWLKFIITRKRDE
ncbi:hypothetical protein KO504_17090 [Winogradskyella psychrotolerans]|uniref:hypothetical protein n=1 Tax=Winogradskyella psychrotolerans TaxID=1344585 RepID=UPI001C06D846|nr:hypothetical protein [Winogradskyella psychrotolerans]MBU2923068.1 hypothetical protein [Winogradskyella psychrotolerans]